MTLCVVLASLIPILWESGIGSDVMKPIAAPIVHYGEDRWFSLRRNDGVESFALLL